MPFQKLSGSINLLENVFLLSGIIFRRPTFNIFQQNASDIQKQLARSVSNTKRESDCKFRSKKEERKREGERILPAYELNALM